MNLYDLHLLAAPCHRRRRHLFRWVYLAAAVLAFGASLATPLHAAPSAEALRWTAWDQCLDSARTVPAALYAFYAYRTLAVPHPEVYLGADQLFSDVIGDLPGGALAYKNKDTHDLRLFADVARHAQKGPGFGWGNWAIIPDSIHDDPADRNAAWFDRRLPSVGVLLKAASPRLSTAECAMMRYAQLRRAVGSPKQLFVVLDVNGVGYLVANSALWRAGLPDRSVDNWASVTPALVFNEQSVYYPLFDRDDRPNDSTLRSVVECFGTAKAPRLKKAERDHLESLRSQLALPDSSAHRLAVLLASGLADDTQPRLRRAWQEYAGTVGRPGSPCATVATRETVQRANLLSPFTASQARLFLTSPTDRAMDDAESAYRMRIGDTTRATPAGGNPTALWGVLWSLGLFEMVVDDNFRTRAGSAFSQTSPMAAALELAGIDSYQLSVIGSGASVPIQEWLVTSDAQYRYSLGHWTMIPQNNLARATVIVTGILCDGRAAIVDSSGLCSSMSELDISQAFLRFGQRLAPTTDMYVIPPHGNLVPIGRFTADLAADAYRSESPAWPR